MCGITNQALRCLPKGESELLTVSMCADGQEHRSIAGSVVAAVDLREAPPIVSTRGAGAADLRGLAQRCASVHVGFLVEAARVFGLQRLPLGLLFGRLMALFVARGDGHGHEHCHQVDRSHVHSSVEKPYATRPA